MSVRGEKHIVFLLHCLDQKLYHNFFFLSSVDGLLACLYLLAIVNSAAVNTYLFEYLSVLLGKYLIVKLMGQMIILSLTF